MNEEIIKFIGSNRLATICLVDKDGKPYGATMYYLYDNNKLKFIAARDTYKFKLMEENPSVCVVICNEGHMSQVTVQGEVHIVHKPIREELYLLMDKLNYSPDNLVDIPLFHMEGPKIIMEIDLAKSEVRLDKFRSGVKNIKN